MSGRGPSAAGLRSSENRVKVFALKARVKPTGAFCGLKEETAHD